MHPDPSGNPGFYSALRRDKRVGAQTLDDRDAWQDRLRPAAFFDKPARQVVVGPGRFGLFLKPSLETPCALAREHLEAVNLANGVQMLLTSLTPRGIGQDIVAGQAKLGRDEAQNLFWDDLVRRQKTSRVSQRTELQGKTDPVFWSPSVVDMLKVIIGEGVVTQH